ncbi:hypothetical protein D3C78_1893120 [compost metagenome]
MAAYSARMRVKMASRKALSLTSSAYLPAMAMSLLASTISMFDSKDVKKGQSVYMPRSTSAPSAGWAAR